MFNSNIKSRHPCLSSSLGESIQLSPLNMMLAVGFYTCHLPNWEFLLYSYFFLKGFLKSWMSVLDTFFVRCFSWMNWYNLVVFILYSWLTWWFTLFDFWILNQPCNLGINSTYSWCIIHKYVFIYCWILFANILLRIFHLYLWRIFVAHIVVFYRRYFLSAR